MYGNGQAPIFILKDGTQRTRGRTAQSNNIAAAKAVADAVRSTLGPKGMDKMLVDSMGDVVITNDGATILKEMDIDHPAAKMIIEVAKTQEEVVGDGTTTAAVLAGELLKQAGKEKKLLAWCKANAEDRLESSATKGEDVLLFIGPEGGFSEKEIEEAVKAKVGLVSISGSRLRTETAALVACHSVAMINKS